MKNRKALYGYCIQNGEIAKVEQEAIVVSRVFTSYVAGMSYQKIADMLNAEAIAYSEESTEWNKHKIKRLLENPRYAGEKGYPMTIDPATFQIVQDMIQQKTENYTHKTVRPALMLLPRLQCTCGGAMHRLAGKNRRKDTLYLKCNSCGANKIVPDTDLLNAVVYQMHDPDSKSEYQPSDAVIRLNNAINRSLEHPTEPKDVVSLILQGAAARYECCPKPYADLPHTEDIDWKAVQSQIHTITISESNHITVTFQPVS